MHTLTHFTNSRKGLINILENGFAWMTNDRVLIHDLLPSADFSEKEPETFGQICFTENSFEADRDGSKFFGSFGIQISRAWALRHSAQPVIYIDKQGPVLDFFKLLFSKAYEKALRKEKYSDDGFLREWRYSASIATMVRQPFYAEMLKLYRYMEPASHSKEREWRVVNDIGGFGGPISTDKAIKNVSPPLGWANVISLLPLEKDDVQAIVCKSEDREYISNSVPEKFQRVKFRLYD